MKVSKCLKAALLGSVFGAGLTTAALAERFNIPAGDLNAALSAYANATGTQLVVSADAVRGVKTRGVSGDYSVDDALSRILTGTGFIARHKPGTSIILRDNQSSSNDTVQDIQLAQATPPPRAAVETVTVTSSKLGGADVQSIPIAITALSQEQLTSTQTAGGPDLVKQVPNLTFSKTNFTGYNIQIRGIGTQAISVETDPAVAVSFNDIPFLRNHFFEQEFFDVSQVEVLRGPQGTLYGRNAPAGVVNVISAKPSDQVEAMGSADFGNYQNRRLEGMVNLPFFDGKLDVRAAGEWTKRKGYSINEQTDNSIDGRDLWSTRLSVGFHPTERINATAVWEHFQEDDDRLRSGKQLCKRDDGPAVIDGPAGPVGVYEEIGKNFGGAFLSQGCLPASLYSPESFETPNGHAIPFIAVLNALTRYTSATFEPYAGLTQSPNLRVIDSSIDPQYKAKNDTLELNADYRLAPGLTITSQTGYNSDHLYSAEDYNRFDSAPGLFNDPGSQTWVGQDGEFCDPQLGCSTRFVAEDVSEEHSAQFYQEIRLSSDLKGPLNFVAGGNYMKYWTNENYYVFINALTLLVENENQLPLFGGAYHDDAPHIPFDASAANICNPKPAGPAVLAGPALDGVSCGYVDPNPLSQVDGQGHNYFLSKNPYQLTSYAGFGEVYYQVMPDLKLTGGLRWTDDQKNFQLFPSWTVLGGKGIPQTGDIRQEWQEFTGHAVATWTPKFDFTDQSLFYASYAHGYKAGGANPPSVTPLYVLGNSQVSPSAMTHPTTFKPEFDDVFEGGTKNTMFDGALTLNADAFFYKYQNYQISQIVDRTSVNLNFNATIRGAEIETTWSPIPGLKLGFNGGYNNATLDGGQSAIDLMDRTAGNSNWLVVKPFVTETSNCVLPTYVENARLSKMSGATPALDCYYAYTLGHDPIGSTGNGTAPYTPNPNPALYPNYPGFDPVAGTPGDPYTGQNTFGGVDYGPAPNNGEGFAKDVGGNQMPSAPHFTTSVSADYTMPLSADWVGTLHSDFYWQSDTFARVFNDRPYDEIHGYTNVNLALIFTNQNGWQVMGYVKNVLNTTAITGAFLNSDDSGLTTNVFTTDPRLMGVRITKNW